MPVNINGLNNLIEHLEACGEGDFATSVQGLQLEKEEILPYAHWSEKQYTRNCVAHSDLYELILLCWEPGQDTPIHDHGGEECWVYLVDGELEEERLTLVGDNFNLDQKRTCRSGDLTYMNDDMGWHKLSNVSRSRSMSLHLYANPIGKCRVYNEDDSKIEDHFPEYDTVKGELNANISVQ